jgi:ribosomal protein S18 acetylase RimI-like enzyme
MNMLVRELTLTDLREVAAVHRAAFTRSALTKLGVEAVRRYYEWQLTGPHDAVAQGAFYDDKLAGFCFGGVYRGAMSGFLLRNRLFLGWRVATHPWLLSNPLFRERLTVGVRLWKKYSRPQLAAPATQRVAPASYTILSIAVDPTRQGLGVGKILMQQSEARAHELGYAQMDLTVDPANEQAIRFYEGLGWRRLLDNGVWRGGMTKALVN